MTRLSLAVLAAAFAPRLEAQLIGPRNTGVLISEVHSGLSGGPAPVIPFRYVELVNIDLAQPANIGGFRIGISTPGIAALSQPFPPGTSIPPGGVALVTQNAFPPQIPLPVGTPVLVDPGLFSPGGILFPGVATTLCLVSPTPNPIVDSLELNGPSPTVTPCGGPGSFSGTLTNSFGHVNRVLYVDSDTFYDYDGGVPGNPATAPVPSPGTVSNQMDHVNGFVFGSLATETGAIIPTSSLPPPVPGIPPLGQTALGSVGGALPLTTIGSLALGSLRVIAVDTPRHPRFPRITDPLFDRTIFDPSNPSSSSTTAVAAVIQARDALLGGPEFPSQTWTMTKPPRPGQTQPGVLQIPMGLMTEQLKDLRPNPLRPGSPRVSRVLSDLTTDSTATGTGDLSKVQIDLLPGSTGGGDIWCDVIVYDENGFSYRAKVRNWPSNPTNCTTPTLGLGSNSTGNLDILALCFTPQPTTRELYVLPTTTVSSPTGSGAFFGITPDALTFSFLTLPLGAAPAHVQTTVDGLYYFSITAPPLSGLSLDAVAVEIQPGGGFTQFSNAATVTIL